VVSQRQRLPVKMCFFALDRMNIFVTYLNNLSDAVEHRLPYERDRIAISERMDLRDSLDCMVMSYQICLTLAVVPATSIL